MRRGYGPERHCPLCTEVIPVYRALCTTCFGTIPWIMRADFLHAYQRRVADHSRYEEALAGLILWKQASDRRKDGEKDIEP